MPGTSHAAPAVEPDGRRLRDRVYAGLLLLAPLFAFSSIMGAQAQQRQFALESIAGLRLHNVIAEPATLQGRNGIRVTISDAARRQVERQAKDDQNRLATAGGTVEQLAVIEGLEFDNGVIQAEIAGAPMPGAPAGARGFVGLAFRLQSDLRTYDAFYLRPTNGRADDQVQTQPRCRSTSRIPTGRGSGFARRRPRSTNPYVDLVPGQWTKVRIEVRGAQARLLCTTKRNRRSSSTT